MSEKGSEEYFGRNLQSEFREINSFFWKSAARILLK